MSTFKIYMLTNIYILKSDAVYAYATKLIIVITSEQRAYQHQEDAMKLGKRDAQCTLLVHEHSQ